jgi:hypothetical protein
VCIQVELLRIVKVIFPNVLTNCILLNVPVNVLLYVHNFASRSARQACNLYECCCSSGKINEDEAVSLLVKV